MEKDDIIFVVNPQSGSKQGGNLMGILAQRYGSRVVNIVDSKADALMSRFEDRLSSARVIVCGGDGSVHSVFQQVELLPLASKPPLGVIPLGTGNDISRCLGWGAGYSGEDIGPICARLMKADSVPLDRWRVVFRTMKENDQQQRTFVINNYLSLGFADAKIALEFHSSREKNPSLFGNRAINKLWYAGYGIKSAIWDKKEVQSIEQVLALEVNGQPIDLSKEPLEGILVLNMVTYAGGMNLWGLPEQGSGFVPAAFDDGKIEVIGIRSAFHLGQVALGLATGVRLGQGDSVSIFYKPNQPPLPYKLDGEPALQTEPVHIQITRGPSLRVLAADVPYISAPVAQKHACKSGSLSKRASSDPHWDMRWFVLTDTRLFYYKSETSLYPQGAVVLSECERVVQETVPERSNCFALHSSNRKLLLQAQSNEEMTSWIAAISPIISVFRSSAAPSSLPAPPAHEPAPAAAAARVATIHSHEFTLIPSNEPTPLPPLRPSLSVPANLSAASPHVPYYAAMQQQQHPMYHIPQLQPVPPPMIASQSLPLLPYSAQMQLHMPYHQPYAIQAPSYAYTHPPCYATPQWLPNGY